MDFTCIWTMGWCQWSFLSQVGQGWILWHRKYHWHRWVKIWFDSYYIDTFAIMFYRDGIDEQDDGDDTHLKLYRGILSLVPYFMAMIKEFGNDFGSITELIDLVRRIPITFFLTENTNRWRRNPRAHDNKTHTRWSKAYESILSTIYLSFRSYRSQGIKLVVVSTTHGLLVLSVPALTSVASLRDWGT